MNTDLRNAYGLEMLAARTAKTSGDLDTAFHHLERAHILGQKYFGPHMQTHWEMFKIGLTRLDERELAGQILRMLAVIPASIFGWVPAGNTGGANVSALKPMPIPEDLAEILERAK